MRALISVLIALAYRRYGRWTELLANEKRRVIRILILLLCTVFLFASAILFFSVLVIAVFWDRQRLAAMGAVIAFYVVSGALAFWGLRRAIKREPRIF